MKILVCITHVPDTTARIAFSADGKALEKQGMPFIIGPYDDYALARAVELKSSHQAEVVVLHVGEEDSTSSLRKALAIGADRAVRIDTAPVDAHTVAYQIASFLKEEPFDLIMMGKEASDFNGGVVHGMVSAHTGIQALSPVMCLSLHDKKVHVQCEIAEGTEELEVPLPLIVGCQEPIAVWKIPNMRGIMQARSKPVKVQPAWAVDARCTSLSFTLPKPRTAVRMFKPEQTEDLVKFLKEAAKVL